MPSSSSVKPNSIIRKQLSPDLRKTYSLGNITTQQSVSNSEILLFSAITGTTSNIALDGTVTTLNGVTLNNGDLVLVKEQTDLSENGLYEVNPTAWNRVDGFLPGCLVVLREGGEEIEDTVYIFASDGVQIGIDDIEFKRLPNTTVTNAGASGIGLFKEIVEENIRLKNIAANSAKIILYDDLSNDVITIDVDVSEINLADLGEKSYNNLTDKPTIDSFALDTTNFNNNLSASDDTAQKAFETLDELEVGNIPEASNTKIPYSDGSSWQHYDGVYVGGESQFRVWAAAPINNGLSVGGGDILLRGIVISTMNTGTTALFAEVLGDGLYVQAGERAFTFITNEKCLIRQNSNEDFLSFLAGGEEKLLIENSGRLATQGGINIAADSFDDIPICLKTLTGGGNTLLTFGDDSINNLEIDDDATIIQRKTYDTNNFLECILLGGWWSPTRSVFIVDAYGNISGQSLEINQNLEINHTDAGYNGILINHLASPSGYSLITQIAGVETLRIMPNGSINAADEIYSQKQMAIGSGANAGAGDTSLLKYSNKAISSGGDDETNVYQFKGEYDNSASGSPYTLEIFDQGVASQRLSIPAYTTAMVEMKVVAYTYSNGASGHASWNIHAMIYRQAGDPINAGEVIVSTVQLGASIAAAPTLNIAGSNIQLECQIPNNMFTRYSADLTVKNITGGS